MTSSGRPKLPPENNRSRKITATGNFPAGNFPAGKSHRNAPLGRSCFFMPFCARPLCAAGCFRACAAHSRCRCGVHLFPQREPLPPHFPHNSTGQTRYEPHSFFSQKHQMKNPFPRLCQQQPSYPRRKVPLMPAPESSSRTHAGAFPPAPVATIPL